MNLIIYLCYPLLAVLLFWGARLYKKGEWNDEFLSLKQTKALQGFCAIAIMLHHIGQKTCAPWLNAKYIVHGLDVFVPIGYWFVAIFFFCSGYGLFKSYRDKPDYFKGFLGRRILPILMAFLTTSVIFSVVGNFRGSYLYIAPLFSMSGPSLPNTYSWYIVTLLLLYLFFYLSFRWIKNIKVAIVVMCAFILGYILFCDWWMYGTWWYNAVLLFGFGILMAYNEKLIIAFVKKRYILNLILALIVLVVSFVLSENIKDIMKLFSPVYYFEFCRITVLLSQMTAASAFTFLVFMIGMKVQIGNKALDFMGTITLEFYLIHGLFVQLFGYCYLDESIKPLTYIKNVALMVPVVLILSLASAVLLKYCHRFLVQLVLSKRALVRMYVKDFGVLFCVLIGVFIVITVITSVLSHKTTVERKDQVESYVASMITYAEVDGKKMSVYCSGEGEHTIVLLAAQFDACPTLGTKVLANDFAKENRVIVIDYFGTGFSDDVDSERTGEQIAYEVHEALTELGEEGPYILVSHEMAGLYAQFFTQKYPDEVEALVMLDNGVAAQFDALLKLHGEEAATQQKALKKEEKVKAIGQDFMIASGYMRMQWPIIESILSGAFKDEDKEVLQEVFLTRMSTPNSLNEVTNNYRNGQQLKDVRYPEDLPVLQLITYQSCHSNSNEEIDWEGMHTDLITNPSLQEQVVVAGNVYAVYYDPHLFYQRAQKFIDKLDE